MKSYQIKEVNYLKNRVRFYYEKSRMWLRKNWFSLSLLAFAIFILMRKDISVNFTMKAGLDPAPANREAPAQLPVAAPVSSTTKMEAKVTDDNSSFGWAKIPELIRNTASKQHLTEAPTTLASATATAKPTDERAALYIGHDQLRFILFPKLAKDQQIGVDAVNAINHQCKAYARRFAPVAMAEMGRYGVPASITIASALLHSNAGQHDLVSATNNHFAIPCFSKECPKGHCSHHDLNEHKAFFRNFNTAWESFRAHSLLLTEKKYKHLHKLDPQDYKAWAEGLQKAGYGSDKLYAAKLIRIIETLGLGELDV